MQIEFESYQFIFENGGIVISANGDTLYKNPNPISIFLKTLSTACEFIYTPYEEISQKDDKIIASGHISTAHGSSFLFNDSYRVTEYGVRLKRSVKVLAEGSELGFSTRFSLYFQDGKNMSDYDCFIPGCQYKTREYMLDHNIGKDTDVEYAWIKETRAALPLISAFDPISHETITFSRWASDVTLRDLSRNPSENTTDPKCTFGSFGLSNVSVKTLNYTYYGYALRKDNPVSGEGLAIDYVYPSNEGELPGTSMYGGLDFKNKPMNMSRFFHPVKTDTIHEYSIAIMPSKHETYNEMMSFSWRCVYKRMRAPLFDVNQEQFFHDCMNIFKTFTTYYDDGSIGLPFAAQLPNIDINSVAFQFGFVGQQPGIGYLLYRYGILEKDAEALKKGTDILDFWVKIADTENGLPPMCYSPTMEGFEPYPHYLRMMADGLEAILAAYKFSVEHNEEKGTWLAFCTKTAEWLINHQNSDGSFYRAYYSDGSIRMESKSNTPSIIRFLIDMFDITGKEEYEKAAIKAGEWTIDNAIDKLEFRGGTCDNTDKQDKEAGIYAMWGLIALYELTSDKKWLDNAKIAADYTETWTYAWEFPVVTFWEKHPFNTYSISGQSIIIIGGAADCYMGACSYTYYHLYELTKDPHYLDFARFLQHNTKQSTDVAGKTGYILPALGNEASDFTNQIVESHYHWLPWCTFIEAEPAARFFDRYGCYDIDDIK